MYNISQPQMSNEKAAKPKILAIVGPTASGKTSLGILLARKFGGEIISADSRQVYRGMNVGTGKVTKREMKNVPHYLLDVVSPKNIFTVTRYQKLGRAAIKKILTKGTLPIIVGGTGLYIDALLYRYALPDVKPNPKLRRMLDAQSTEKLFARLAKLDPRRANTIDRYNKRRLVRALEIVLGTKKPVPDANDALNKESDYDFLKIGVSIDPKKLEKNIRTRLIKRFRQGMLREVKNLHEKDGVSWKRLDDLGLEYRYIGRYLRGLILKKEMMEQLEKEINRYAKRQMTWFRKDKNIRWVETEKEALKLAQVFLK
jgi:tRNA dimethylallyltransferase